MKTPEERSRYMWHMKEAAALRAPGLAPDVVRAGGDAEPATGERGSGPAKASPSLSKKLWKLFIE